MGGLTLGLLATVVPAADAAPAATSRRPSHVVLMVTGSDAALTGAKQDARNERAHLRQDIPGLHMVSLGVPPGRQLALQRKLARRGLTVEPARKLKKLEVPDDPGYPTQQSYLDQVKASAAWSLSHGSSSVKLAVVDSGLDISHPDLASKVVATRNVVEGSSDVTDLAGHGTMVAGVAAATTDNAVGIAGTGFDTRLLGVKVEDAAGDISADDVVAGIKWAADNGAKVINISLGASGYSNAEAAAVSYAQSKGAIVVAAAGNEGQSGAIYPAGYAGVIAVGATDPSTGKRAGFSNYGSWVDLAAPGVGIYGTTASGSYAAANGTSFSSPMVAGAVALMRGYQPSASASTITSALVKSAKPLSGQYLGAGLLDMSKAMSYLLPTTVPTFTSPAPGAVVSGNQAVSLTTTSSLVQLFVDGVKWGGRVSSGGALSIPTYGLSNGAHTFGAVDCNLNACASTPSETLAVDVQNAAPAVTTPGSDGAVLMAGTTFAASAAGGGVRFLVDGAVKGFDATAPYAISFNASTLTNGPHALKVQSCNTAGTVCNGPVSAERPFTVSGLHPSIISATSPFSPNGDGALETTTWKLRLETPQTVSYEIRNKNGTKVAGANVGTRNAGDHVFTWNGKQPNGSRWADGDYTITVTTTSGALKGLATRVVRLDGTAPVMTKILGASGWVFPVVDGYRDKLAMGVTVNESATVNLRVVNSKGTLVRSLWASRSGAGAVPFTWNGRNASGYAVPAGTYTFWFVSNDPVKNVRKSSSYHVAVSWKKLVSKTATITRAAHQAIGIGEFGEYLDSGQHATCTQAALNPAYELYLVNYCDGIDTTGVAFADYGFTLPSAVSYSSFRLDGYGYSQRANTVLTGLVWHVGTKLFDMPRWVEKPTTSTSWTEGICWPPAKDHWQTDGRYVRMRIALLDDPYGRTSVNYVIKSVRLIVSYKALV